MSCTTLKLFPPPSRMHPQVEQLSDPVLPVSEIVRRCPARQLMELYKVAAFGGAEQFLQLVATARGKLKKGGTVDMQVRDEG